VHRVTGRSLREFVAEEVAGPLEADFQLGLADKDLGRVADVVPPPPAPGLEAIDQDSPAAKTFAGPALTADAANTPAWRAADLALEHKADDLESSQGGPRGAGPQCPVDDLASVVGAGPRPSDRTTRGREPRITDLASLRRRCS
jgi:CubicO group peptidase (beta-lactamase class C family)